MPKLALKSATVLHSLLAASAVCLCHNLISQDLPPDASAVNEILLTGYRHYNLAIQQIRESMSSPFSLDPEILLASAILLVPFATASQQINHWLSSNSMKADSCRPLSSTPRDVVIIMRAIRTMLETQRSASSSPQQMDAQEDLVPVPDTSLRASLTPSCTHVMFPILTATIHPALAKLQQRLDSASFALYDGQEDIISSCATAFSVLKSIVGKVFPCPNDVNSSLESSADRYYELKRAALPHVAPWLRSYARKATGPLPADLLTSIFLGFYIQVPQAYLDITIPLLDQRLESPLGGDDGTSNGIFTELSVQQALALDIYAHWSVLMFLVEEESWWIGNLPTVTLNGMVNRYGDDFMGKLWPEMADSESWWPGSMLRISQEIRLQR
ncbi:hypothetical protein FKW77_007543 [Venturia effusa]|uniref:C6 transcription factor n=1 Tax=Venturia effusa TaxID=50376 RepID=A0A517KZQ7_9PEZI|nr:hypothetical protein FKW77_007543 [Venturia effusa]